MIGGALDSSRGPVFRCDNEISLSHRPVYRSSGRTRHFPSLPQWAGATVSAFIFCERSEGVSTPCLRQSLSKVVALIPIAVAAALLVRYTRAARSISGLSTLTRFSCPPSYRPGFRTEHLNLAPQSGTSIWHLNLAPQSGTSETRALRAWAFDRKSLLFPEQDDSTVVRVPGNLHRGVRPGLSL